MQGLNFSRSAGVIGRTEDMAVVVANACDDDDADSKSGGKLEKAMAKGDPG